MRSVIAPSLDRIARLLLCCSIWRRQFAISDAIGHRTVAIRCSIRNRPDGGAVWVIPYWVVLLNAAVAARRIPVTLHSIAILHLLI